MSYANLLSSLSSERKEFVYKINGGMCNNANANSDRENRKDYFISLVEKTRSFLKMKKNIARKGLFMTLN